MERDGRQHENRKGKRKRKQKPTYDNKISTFTILLRSMPLGNSMDIGKGYDDMIGCATCSLSQRLMQ